MRRTLGALLASGLVGVLAWVLWPKKEQPIEMVPAQILGLVTADRLPESLGFLPKTRLGEWLEIDPANVEPRRYLEAVKNARAQTAPESGEVARRDLAPNGPVPTEASTRKRRFDEAESAGDRPRKPLSVPTEP